MLRIYFAGPLFTTAERDFNAAVVKLLRGVGYEVFLPQEQEQKPPVTAANIYMGDINGIEWADVVVANMDGPDPDSGTCWECGHAHGAHKPVILYRTDIRNEDPFGPFNLMLHQSALATLDLKWQTVDEVANAIHAALGRGGKLAKGRP